jgi:hypothetical protein
MSDESFGLRVSAFTDPVQLLTLERDGNRGESFAHIDALIGDVLVRCLHAEFIVEAKRSRHEDSVSITGLNDDDKLTLDENFSVDRQHARGAWFHPETVSLKQGLVNLPFTFANYPRYATGIAWEERAKVSPLHCPTAVLLWAVFQPLFEQLFIPFDLRGRLAGTKSAEDQLAEWKEVDRLIEALGIDVSDELAVMRYGGGWGRLRGAEQLEAKQRLLTSLAAQVNTQMARRFRAYCLMPLIARYYGKAQNGQALRKSVLTKTSEKTLCGFFGGDWLKFLQYIGESPHPSEQIATAIPAAQLFVGTTKSAAAIAAEAGLPADEVERALSSYWETSGGPVGSVTSPVMERVAILKSYWARFGEIHDHQTPGMPSLWGLVEERRGNLSAEMDDSDVRYRPGYYRELLDGELLRDIDRLWSPIMLARWPERIVTEISPHALLCEAFGAALTFWHGVSLTAWFVSEGPYSRTNMAGLATYYADQLEQLEAMHCPIEPGLFTELIDAEARLGSEEPISPDKSRIEVSPGVYVETVLSSAMRRPGFEGLRDVVTRYRRSWSEHYLDSYLKARWELELREAARHHAEQIAEKGKVPTPKQFAKFAVAATNHWLGGDMRSLYAAIGEKLSVTPVRVRLMPSDRLEFAKRVFDELGGKPFVRRVFVATREEGLAQGAEQDRYIKLCWLAEQCLHFTQLEEALGRRPELKEFGTTTFEYRCPVLSPDTQTGWDRYVAIVEAVRLGLGGVGQPQPVPIGAYATLSGASAQPATTVQAMPLQTTVPVVRPSGEPALILEPFETEDRGS